MKSVFAIVFVSLLCASNAGSVGNHPIEKVINLIEGLKEKSIQEGKDEAVAFTKFQYWCKTSTDTLNDAIAEEKETIEELTDKISGLTKKKETLENEIDDLADELKDLDNTATEAKKDRKNDANLYDQANKDLASTIKSVEQCIQALEGAEG